MIITLLINGSASLGRQIVSCFPQKQYFLAMRETKRLNQVLVRMVYKLVVPKGENTFHFCFCYQLLLFSINTATTTSSLLPFLFLFFYYYYSLLFSTIFIFYYILRKTKVNPYLQSNLIQSQIFSINTIFIAYFLHGLQL